MMSDDDDGGDSPDLPPINPHRMPKGGKPKGSSSSNDD